MKKSKLKVSIIINGIIFLMVLFATIIMFTGYKFMHGHEVVLESTRFGVFKYFTVQSNIFMGIMALIFVIKNIELLKGKIKNIDRKYYIWKLASTSAVSLTFITVFTYLGAIVEGGVVTLLMNSSLFFHLIVPVLSIICFIFLDRTKGIKYKETFYGLLPTLLYAVYYITNVLVHVENGKVSPKYDWYWFVQKGTLFAFIIVIILFLISYLISVLLWKLNKGRK